MAKRPIVTEGQADVLKMLAGVHSIGHDNPTGRWSPTSGWTWGGSSNTIRILRALEKKGFTRNLHMSEYEITAAGRALAAELAS